MRLILLIAACILCFPLCFPVPAGALEPDVVSEPVCFEVVNNAPYSVFGNVATNYDISADGTKMRHRSNFRLAPEERTDFCTTGPFFEGRKIELVLRTLVPVFSCKTRVDAGPIIIHGLQKKDGGTETWADCF